MNRLWQTMGGLLVVVALVGTACGGGDRGEGVASLGGSKESPSGRSGGKDFETAALAFAKCMRERGVEVETNPDGTGGVAINLGETDPQKAQAAEKECRHHLEGVAPPEGAPRMSAEERARQLESMLRFARCMRGHGIDFPDPREDGSGRLLFGPDESEDIRDPDFRAAEEQCRKAAPGLFGEARDVPGPRR